MTKKLGIEPTIHPDAHVSNSKLGHYTEVGARTSVTETIMGDYSYVVNDSNIIYTEIGKHCSIAAMTRINPGNHPIWRATQCHFTYRSTMYFDGVDDEEEFFNWRRAHKVKIGHDAWLGHGAVILAGRTIGNGAVVAAGSIVTKDVAPYSIVGGNPAREIKRRYTSDVADRMQQLAWWHWTHEQLREALPDFRALDAEAFLEKYENVAR